MTIRTLSMLLLPSVLLLSALFLTPTVQAQPTFYETVLTLQEPVVNVSSVTHVIYRWSTFQDLGLVTEFDLEDLTLELRTPEGPLYVDRMIVNGVAQPLSGQPRTIGGGSDVFWQFNLNTLGLEQMTNVSEPVILGSVGEHFDVHDSISIPDDGRVSIKKYIDGVNQDPHTDQLQVQVTLPMVFFDDFETGNLSVWSSSSP